MATKRPIFGTPYIHRYNFRSWAKERREASLRESGELLSARAYVLSAGRVGRCS